jgi:hypothetical protein
LLAVDIRQKHHAVRSCWPCGDIPIEIYVEPSVALEMITLDVNHMVPVVAFRMDNATCARSSTMK